MVAICNSSGAYIYNCSEKAADNRIEKTNESIYARGGMDYDENGNHRMEDACVDVYSSYQNLLISYHRLV